MFQVFLILLKEVLLDHSPEIAVEVVSLKVSSQQRGGDWYQEQVGVDAQELISVSWCEEATTSPSGMGSCSVAYSLTLRRAQTQRQPRVQAAVDSESGWAG